MADRRSLQELLTLAGTLNISISELAGEGVFKANIPSTASSNEEDKEEAPIGFIPNGASYDVVAGARFELATSGLRAPIWSKTVITAHLLQKIFTHIASHMNNEM